MKKWLIGVLAIVILFLIGCQIFIPQNITLTRSVIAKANLNGVYRYLSSDSNWKKWWPEQFSANGESATPLLKSGEFQFIKTKLGYNSFEIVIKKDKETIPSLLHLVAYDKDSIKIEWNTTLRSNRNNPFSKISHYLDTRNLNRRLGSILTAMQKHISQVRHIYGVDVRKEKITLEFLVSRIKKIPHYPTNEDIYGMMNEIKDHLQKKQVKEEALPIFNIEPAGANEFELLVAIPVANPLEDDGDFKTLKLLKGGSILVTEVHGDRAAVETALQQIKIYAKDHQHLNVARPYRILLTNQMNETDSSKWLTRISYPYI